MLGDIDTLVMGESLVCGELVTFTETEAEAEWLGLPDIDIIGVSLYIAVIVPMGDALTTLLADMIGE